jgi:hypothetical protein
MIMSQIYDASTVHDFIKKEEAFWDDFISSFEGSILRKSVIINREEHQVLSSKTEDQQGLCQSTDVTAHSRRIFRA